MHVLKALQFCMSLLIIITLSTIACGKGGLKSEQDKISYSLGAQFGNSLKQQKITLDTTKFSKGLNDAFDDKTPEFKEVEIAQIINDFQNEMRERMSAGGEPGEFKVDMNKVSYIIGSQYGQNFKLNEIDINTDIFVRGLDDITNDRTPALTDAETGEVMQKFEEDMRAKQEAAHNEALTRNKAEASAFLEENAKKSGITTLPDSLQYEIITEGSGPKPKAENTVKVHYKGTLIDGTEFDSSYRSKQPAEFPLTGVIKGWTEVLQLMKTGAKWKVFIPPELGYGANGSPPIIGPNSLLIFEIELLEIVK